jgi:hypothetical protein
LCSGESYVIIILTAQYSTYFLKYVLKYSLSFKGRREKVSVSVVKYQISFLVVVVGKENSALK